MPETDPTAPPRSARSPLPAGLAAGLGLALVEGIATGVDHLNGHLLLLLLGFGLLLGGASALLTLVTRAVRLPPSPLALVLAGALFLDGGARLSNGPGLAPLPLLVLVLLSLATWRGALHLSAGAFIGFVALASIPGGALLGHLLGNSSAAVLGSCALPPVTVVILGRAGTEPSKRLGHLGRLAALLLAGGALALPVSLLDAVPSRPELPAETPRSSRGGAPERAPDVVLLLVDTMRDDAVPTDGWFDRLSRRGVRFDSAVATAPWTLPSVASILTGLLPSQHGATAATRPLARDVTTLAESFRAAGYQTAALTGGGFVRASFGLDQGFEHFDADVELGFPPFRIHTPLPWRLLKNRFFTLDRLVSWVGEYRGCEGLARSAHSFWRNRDATRPCFLALHTYEVHDYYLRRPELDAVVGTPPSKRFRGRFSIHPAELVDAEAPDLAHFERVYRHRAEHVDAVLGPLLGELEATSERGVVIAIVADHGEGFDAVRRRVHHGGRLHQDLLHVPMLLVAPGRVPADRHISMPVSTVDLAPTLLELAGITAPSGIAGRSLLAVVEGDRIEGRDAWSEEHANGRNLLALRHGFQKALREQGEAWAFDLAGDPFEDLRLAVPAELELRLSSFSARYPPREVVEVPLDPGSAAQLRNLGYVE